MRFIYVFVLIFLCACEKKQRFEFKAPDYFFSWNSIKKEGACTNQKGETGFNPRFLGPCGDLRGYSFPVSNLDGVDFRGAILDGMNLSGFSLNGANFNGAMARGTNFSEAKMNGVKFMYGHFEGSNFEKAELNGADFEGAFLSGSSLVDSSLRGANYVSSDLSGAKLPAKLNMTKLENSIYSYGTKIPFSEKIAEGRGMRAIEKRTMEMPKDDSKVSEDVIRMPSSKPSGVLEDRIGLKISPKNNVEEKLNWSK